jgi:hypothetical protein
VHLIVQKPLQKPSKGVNQTVLIVRGAEYLVLWLGLKPKQMDFFPKSICSEQAIVF